MCRAESYDLCVCSFWTKPAVLCWTSYWQKPPEPLEQAPVSPVKKIEKQLPLSAGEMVVVNKTLIKL